MTVENFKTIIKPTKSLFFYHHHVLEILNNNGAKVEELYVKEARVDAGPVMKRHMFDSRSHIGHKDKRTSHIVITVASK